jgi:hypothetical protein
MGTAWGKEEALQSLRDFFKSINHKAIIFSSNELEDGFYIKSEYSWTAHVYYGSILVIDKNDNYYYLKDKFKKFFEVMG